MLFSLLLLSLLSFSAALAATFPDCHLNFTCGNLTAAYPFTGNLRPRHCGPPEFHLTCINSATTELTLNSLTYRVNSLSESQLSLSRSDLATTTCPKTFLNTTFDENIFTPVSHENLTIFYSCNFTLNYSPQNLFTCRVNGSDNMGAFFLVGPIPFDPVLWEIAKCPVIVTVPVAGEAARGLAGNLTSLGEALKMGFDVNYRDPYADKCRECVEVGGRCGFDPGVEKFVCICSDRVCDVRDISSSRSVSIGLDPMSQALRMGFDVTYWNPHGDSCRDYVGVGRRCGFDPVVEEFICICGDRACDFCSIKRKKTVKRVITGLLVAGSVAGCLIIGFAIFACRKRRNRTVTRSIEFSETKPEDIPFTHLTESFTATTSSTNNSHSTASFLSSNNESGKSSSYFGVKVFNCAELEEATDNFNPSREIGDGGFGTVFYGKLCDGREVAVKRLYENNFKRVEQFINEVEILTGLSHINLVKLYGCTSRRSRELLLVYEYIPNGTVADHLHGKRKNLGLLSWPIRLNIALETAEALAYLHKSDIIHRDVKTTNILLNNDFHVKVADFGLSRLFPTDVTHVSTAPQGTPGYVDPEYYRCYQLTEKSDVYSFGVVLVELISSKQAVDINRDRHDINLSNMAVNKIQNGELFELVDLSLGFETDGFVEKTVTSVAEIAFRCLQNERDMRPSMGEVLEALKRIKSEDLNDPKVEVMDTVIGDEAVLLKNNCSPISPSSVIVDVWISSSTTPCTGS